MKSEDSTVGQDNLKPSWGCNLQVLCWRQRKYIMYMAVEVWDSHIHIMTAQSFIHLRATSKNFSSPFHPPFPPSYGLRTFVNDKEKR